MVSGDDAKQVFGRAFSRPPRLLFTNPVCAIFSAYYAYIYGESRPILPIATANGCARG
jgi:DHA1 family multidrug resistance protein-like MFS transporter